MSLLLYIVYWHGIAVTICSIEDSTDQPLEEEREQSGEGMTEATVAVSVVVYTVDRERFAGLNICGFSAIEVFMRSAHYLVQLKRGAYIPQKTFMVLLKTWKKQKFSPANLSLFTIYHIYCCEIQIFVGFIY